MTADEILEKKIKQAKEFAGEKGFLNRKQFAEIAEMHVSQVSGIIKNPNFGKVLRKKTKVGKGPVMIPLDTVLAYIQKNFFIE